jgi:predicted transcriptional regulator YdeE
MLACVVSRMLGCDDLNKIEATSGGQMVTPEPATRAELMMVGIAARTSNTREANPSTGQIPALWERFFREGLGERIPKQVGGQTMYSAYTDYESDETGEYRIVVGVEVHNLSQVPEGMVGVVVPTGAYLLFHARGTMPGALIETWQAIWSHFARFAPEACVPDRPRSSPPRRLGCGRVRGSDHYRSWRGLVIRLS